MNGSSAPDYQPAHWVHSRTAITKKKPPGQADAMHIASDPHPVATGGRRYRERVARLAAGFLLLLLRVPVSLADGGPFGIDHEWTYDNSGIWKRSVQVTLEYGLIGGEVVGALWEGGETRFGRTLWQSIDASASSAIVAVAMEYAFSRARPIDSKGDPNQWFKGDGNRSFPSGEVTAVSAIVTPLMAEYGPEHPLTYALEVLPVYDALARMKLQAHWQSDVIAGFALGTGAGWLMHANPNTPYILRVMPHAIYIGIGKRF